MDALGVDGGGMMMGVMGEGTRVEGRTVEKADAGMKRVVVKPPTVMGTISPGGKVVAAGAPMVVVTTAEGWVRVSVAVGVSPGVPITVVTTEAGRVSVTGGAMREDRAEGSGVGMMMIVVRVLAEMVYVCSVCAMQEMGRVEKRVSNEV